MRLNSASSKEKMRDCRPSVRPPQRRSLLRIRATWPCRSPCRGSRTALGCFCHLPSNLQSLHTRPTLHLWRPHPPLCWLQSQVRRQTASRMTVDMTAPRLLHTLASRSCSDPSNLEPSVRYAAPSSSRFKGKVGALHVVRTFHHQLSGRPKSCGGCAMTSPDIMGQERRSSWACFSWCYHVRCTPSSLVVRPSCPRHSVWMGPVHADRWLTGPHPDPDGFHLEHVARIAMGDKGGTGYLDHVQNEIFRELGLASSADFALFWYTVGSLE